MSALQQILASYGASASSGPITLVQNSGTVHGAAATSVQYTWPTPPIIGNKVIVTFVGYNSSGGPVQTVTDDAGNTYTARSAVNNPGGQTRSTIFEATISAIPTKTTVAMTSAVDYAGTFSEWANVGAFDTQATGNSNGSPASLGPTATLAQADELVITVFGAATSSASSGIAVPSGFTSLGLEQNSSAYIGMGSAYRIVNSTAPITAAWTFTAGSANGRALATFRKA
jgi:hypothetical protein